MELYHALNRGVERRTLFEDDMDRARFVHDLYEFNDTAPANNDRRLASMIEIRSQSLKITTLGRGLSTGSELEYADADTLRNALDSRK